MAERYDFYVHDNRKITFNLTEPIMREDSGVTDFVFHIPKILNELEVSDWSWWFVFANAKKEKYSIALTLSDDPESPLEKNVATYTVDYAMSIKAGSVQFALEAINAGTGGAIDNEWHTLTYETKVKETLQGNQAEYAETESDIISALIQEVRTKMNQVIGGATPTPVNLKSQMTDPNAVYLYIGSEPNEHAGHWYYHNGTTFVSGGVYGAGVTDAVPTQGSTNAVQSEGVYSALQDKADKDSTPETVTPEETDADFYLSDSNGNVLLELADGHVRTKNFDSSDINTETDTTLTEEGKPADAKATGDRITAVEEELSGIDTESPVKDASSADADLYICDSFGNVVGEFGDGHIRTKNFDSADMEGIPEDVSALQTDVSALQSATSGILYRTKDQTDGVYASCRWRQPTLSSKQFCMLIAGDIHTDPERMLNLVEYLNAVDAFDAGIMLGDLSGNTYTDPITHYANAVANTEKPFLSVLGNHDVQNGASSDADLWSKYGDLFQYADLASGEAVNGKCYYYKDFASYKIRVIVLMQYDYVYTGELCFGQTQIDWLIGVLNSTPSDYGVIICEHTNPSRYMTYEMDLAFTSSTWKRSNYAPTVMDGDPVPDIVNAWINGTTLSQTYSYTYENPPDDLSVSADFTSRGTGEFITYLGGHWHMNVLGHPTPYTDQMDCHVPACGLSAATQGDMPRRAGTVSEDSFCAIGIDRDSKTVKIFQVGAHYTKDAVDRQYFQYSYGGTQ